MGLNRLAIGCLVKHRPDRLDLVVDQCLEGYQTLYCILVALELMHSAE